jgi:hypothetical protein
MDAQSFLQVGKAELLGGARHFIDEWIGERNVFVILELLLPILGVQSSFLAVWVVKQAEEAQLQ